MTNINCPNRSNENRVDDVLLQIADYIDSENDFSLEARRNSRLCLMDSLACALYALHNPDCKRLLGGIVPHERLPSGARVPATAFQLDPVQAAFNLGALIRWIDFNDTWLAAEWGHPSDNLAGILSIADYLGRNPGIARKTFNLREILKFLIKAYEIQGVLALSNNLNQHGIDHVLLVKIATAGVVTSMLGGSKNRIINAISNAWADGASLRIYRHGDQTGSRKSWAAGDAASRGVRLALWAMQDEMGYPAVLSDKNWGFSTTFLDGKPVSIERDLGCYVMENILFKIAYPAEFHAQTAIEAALILYPQVKTKLDQIDSVVIETQKSAMRIINKTGRLRNAADRDHCIQYMVAVALIEGSLDTAFYEDAFAQQAIIDRLREKIKVIENPDFSRDYLDAEKRSIANSVQIFFKDGSKTRKQKIDYPIGHKRRRAEALPLLRSKFEKAVTRRFTEKKSKPILLLYDNVDALEKMPVTEFIDLFSIHDSIPGKSQGTKLSSNVSA